MRTLKKVLIFNLKEVFAVSDILYVCGKDMATKMNLHHWDNSRFKTFLITLFCLVKNTVYLVSDEDKNTATFQVHIQRELLKFSKLATRPNRQGTGLGSYCLYEIEKLAKQEHCSRAVCDVYEKSNHAISFYKKHGYVICGTTESLKYKELKMEKRV